MFGTVEGSSCSHSCSLYLTSSNFHCQPCCGLNSFTLLRNTILKCSWQSTCFHQTVTGVWFVDLEVHQCRLSAGNWCKSTVSAKVALPTCMYELRVECVYLLTLVYVASLGPLSNHLHTQVQRMLSSSPCVYTVEYCFWDDRMSLGYVGSLGVAQMNGSLYRFLIQLEMKTCVCVCVSEHICTIMLHNVPSCGSERSSSDLWKGLLQTWHRISWWFHSALQELFSEYFDILQHPLAGRRRSFYNKNKKNHFFTYKLSYHDSTAVQDNLRQNRATPPPNATVIVWRNAPIRANQSINQSINLEHLLLNVLMLQLTVNEKQLYTVITGHAN